MLKLLKKHLKEPRLNVMFVECDNKLVLSEDKLAKLYDEIDNQFFEYYPSRYTWLMCDHIALAASYKVAREKGIELKIAVFKSLRTPDVIKSVWIDSERQVSLQ
jgi:hypothetical protein